MKRLSVLSTLVFCTLINFSVAYAQTYGPDFDGDGFPDLAGYEVQNDNSANEIAVSWQSSSSGAVSRFEFGKSEESPVFSDYDGDGKTDPAVVGVNDLGEYVWRYKLSSQGGAVSTNIFGRDGNMVFFGCHFDEDNITDRADLTLSGTFTYEKTATQTAIAFELGNGGAFDRFMCADLDGDGIDEVIAQRSISVTQRVKAQRKKKGKRKPKKQPTKIVVEKSFFYVWNVVSGARVQEFEFGTNVKGILAADIDGDGIEEVAIERDGSGRSKEIVFRSARGQQIFTMPGYLKAALYNFSGAVNGVSGAFVKVSGDDRYFKIASFADTSATETVMLGGTDAPLRTRGSTYVGPLKSRETFCGIHLEPADGPNGFLWKPVSDTTSNAVVVLPAGTRLKNVRIVKNGKTLETLRYGGNANGGRDHWRSAQRSSSFPDLITITGVKDKVNYCWLIENPLQRVD